MLLWTGITIPYGEYIQLQHLFMIVRSIYLKMEKWFIGIVVIKVLTARDTTQQ